MIRTSVAIPCFFPCHLFSALYQYKPPPPASSFRTTFDELSDFFLAAHVIFQSERIKRGNLCGSYFMVGGDFNLPNVDWRSFHKSNSTVSTFFPCLMTLIKNSTNLNPPISDNPLEILLFNSTVPGGIKIYTLVFQLSHLYDDLSSFTLSVLSQGVILSKKVVDLNSIFIVVLVFFQIYLLASGVFCLI